MKDTTSKPAAAAQAAPTKALHPKATAAVAGGSAGAVVSQFAVWAESHLWWGGDAVPVEVSAFTALVVTAALALGAAVLRKVAD